MNENTVMIFKTYYILVNILKVLRIELAVLQKCFFKFQTTHVPLTIISNSIARLQNKIIRNQFNFFIRDKINWKAIIHLTEQV